jgi:ATPase subunit of ABC transporter with duplicated ATPase domains
MCRYGITGRLQTAKIGMLSEGQKSRLIFAMMCMKVSCKAAEQRLTAADMH